MSVRMLIIEGDANEFFDVGSGLDESAEMTVKIIGGPLDGQTVEMWVEKHICGAYGKSATASGGSSWQSEMNGCWQQGHSRTEEGNRLLAELFTLKYEIEYLAHKKNL